MEQFQPYLLPTLIGVAIMWVLYNRGYIASSGNSNEPTLDPDVMIYRQLKRRSHSVNEKECAKEIIDHVRKYKPNPDEIRLKVDSEPEIKS